MVFEATKPIETAFANTMSATKRQRPVCKERCSSDRPASFQTPHEVLVAWFYLRQAGVPSIKATYRETSRGRLGKLPSGLAPK